MIALPGPVEEHIKLLATLPATLCSLHLRWWTAEQREPSDIRHLQRNAQESVLSSLYVLSKHTECPRMFDSGKVYKLLCQVTHVAADHHLYVGHSREV